LCYTYHDMLTPLIIVKFHWTQLLFWAFHIPASKCICASLKQYINQGIQYSLVYVKKRTCLTVDVVKTEKEISLDKCYVESFASHSHNNCGCFVSQICILGYCLLGSNYHICWSERNVYTKFEKDFGFEGRLSVADN
jgi:hypothetical protein